LITARVRFRLLRKLALSYEYNKLNYRPDPAKNSTIINVVTADYNFTRDLWIRLFAQNNVRNDRIYIYGLFGWRFQPPFGAIYLIYTSDKYSLVDPPVIQENQFAFFKISYQLGI